MMTLYLLNFDPLEQGRCYLSAETLSEMKEWVSRVREALEEIDHNRNHQDQVGGRVHVHKVSFASLRLSASFRRGQIAHKV